MQLGQLSTGAKKTEMAAHHRRPGVTKRSCGMLTAALLALMTLIESLAAATLTGKAEIVDGDTIKVGGIPVRLYGIDAPEGRQTCDLNGKAYACGKRATRELAELIAGKSVECEIVGKDAFHRALGICSVTGIELNATMVSHGWALAFVKYSDHYSADQERAKLAKRGLWSGSFVSPWDWRLGEAQAALKTRGCVIKGNITRKGEHIYHVPSQQFYARAKIDEGKGERWFCTETEALKAGWRRSLR